MSKKVKKITSEELASANEWVSNINQYAKRIQDLEVAKLDSYSGMNQCRVNLDAVKKELEEKYGSDVEINLETGEISKPEKE